MTFVTGEIAAVTVGRLGLEPEQVIQEFGWDEDIDEAFRAQVVEAVIDVIDPITKKKSTISVFELIMKAQDAKVIELGPGFLKWYTEIDVLEHEQALITTPKTGN